MTKEEQLKIYSAYLPYRLQGQLMCNKVEDFDTLSGIVLKQHNYTINKEWVNDRGCFTIGYGNKINPIHHVTMYRYPHYHSWFPFSIEDFNYLVSRKGTLSTKQL
ncbi:hypothetical protein EGI16_12170 [Chryseobacterium sp. G0240]|uniref:hypothetical protein n=1 Tax=Chryseobacterium sp. G0240 TaxID=2487066 RepID=UPI000F45CC29|nr:hypothetical protein [Chryseobacterium sp. G0240]ROI02921.1 hypothetical protein EGI16_12170 [Chryseobacterium sp. G0240]